MYTTAIEGVKSVRNTTTVHFDPDDAGPPPYSPVPETLNTLEKHLGKKTAGSQFNALLPLLLLQLPWRHVVSVAHPGFEGSCLHKSVVVTAQNCIEIDRRRHFDWPQRLLSQECLS